MKHEFRSLFFSTSFFAIFLALFCGSVCTASGKRGQIQLKSKAFIHGGMIPSKFTCQGKNVSPALEWKNVPTGAKSLALICDDPDAPMGTWVHWVLFNIPADTKGLPEGIPPLARLKNGAVHGINDFKKLGYGGPCPPSGTHRYFFKIYALDSTLSLEPGATKAQVLQAMKGHVVGTGVLMGRYRR